MTPREDIMNFLQKHMHNVNPEAIKKVKEVFCHGRSLLQKPDSSLLFPYTLDKKLIE